MEAHACGCLTNPRNYISNELKINLSQAAVAGPPLNPTPIGKTQNIGIGAYNIL